MNEIDLKTLSLLQKNGRTPNAELARMLAVAPSTMLEKIRRYEERGIVEGYRAMLNPKALGWEVNAFVSISLSEHDKAAIEHFEQEVQTIPFIRACYHLTGRFDYLLLVVARDLSHLGELVKRQIAQMKGIGKAETFLILSDVKKDVGWPMPEDVQQITLPKKVGA